MNITDPYSPGQTLIGLIELPDLAETLTRCGIKVVTGPDFRSAATAIRAELSTSGAFPMIVADIPAPGLRAWIDRVQQTAQQQGVPIAASVLRNPENPVISSPNVTELIEPFTVNHLLKTLGLPEMDVQTGSTVYPEGMSVAGNPATTGLTIPDFGDIFENEGSAGIDDSILTPQNEEFDHSDDWNSPNQVVSAQKSAILEPVAPILDDWDTIAPPALAPEAPAFAEDDWDTPSPAQAHPAPFAPLPVAPGAAVDPAPAIDDWDTPAPAAVQPMSRREARAMAPVPVAEDWDTPAPAPAVYQAPSAAAAPAQYAAPAAPFAPAPVAAAPAAPAPVAPEPVRYAAPVMPAPVEYEAPALLEAPALYGTPVRYEAPAEAEHPNWDAVPASSAAVAVPNQQVSEAWAAQRQPLRDKYDVADASAIFDNFEASKLSGTGRSAAGLGSFVINFSGKGGVGKSTTSLQMAHVAAAAGLRVILIDGNSGQGDLRTYLRLNRTSLPTIYDAAIKSIRSAVLTPDIINSHREDNLGLINFAFIAAPPDDINDPSVITNQLYQDVITYARRNADLVILDTQIIETSDRTGVVGQILLPALVHDAWGLGIADMSNTGVNNLNNRLRIFMENGVPQDRLMVMVNKVYPEQATVAATMRKYFNGLGFYLGSIATDLDVQQDMNAGRINIGNQDLRTLMSKALLRITGNDGFRADAEYEPEEAAPKGFFAKVFGKK